MEHRGTRKTDPASRHKQKRQAEAAHARRARARRRRDHLRTSYDPIAYGHEHVPISPVLDLTLTHLDKLQVVEFTVISGDRRAGVAEKFGHDSQLYLFEHQNDPGFNPANPPLTSSHEYKNGGSNPRFPGYVGGPAFPRIKLGAKLKPQQLGIDLGSNEEASRFCSEVKHVDLEFFQPYNTGSELHHVCCRMGMDELIKWLEHHHVIR
jgi:hypothetical protein